MDPIVVGLLGVAALLILLFLGVHIGMAMVIVGFVGVTIVMGSPTAALGYLRSTPFSTSASFSISVIPMFVLMGQICYYAGISGDLYNFCHKFLGRIRGGLSVATIAACGGFSAICGSATATTATMGVVCLPEMEKYGYKDTLSTGSISAGGTLGILIPPSTGFILYGTSAQVAVGKMFAAGIFPGILLAVLYAITVIIICMVDKNAGPKGEKFSMREKVKSIPGVLPIAILFVIVLGGIFMGKFTPSEGASIGAFGSFIFMLIRRKATLKNIIAALFDTIKTTAMIFLIMIGAYIFGYFLTASNMPSALANWVASLNVPVVVILIGILLVYAILGMFVDSLPLIVLLVPIFLPIIDQLQIIPNQELNRIWFGVLMVMIMQLGLITPPVGMCCYVMAGVAQKVPLQRIFKGTAPFILALLVGVLLAIFITPLSTWLPSMMS